MRSQLLIAAAVLSCSVVLPAEALAQAAPAPAPKKADAAAPKSAPAVAPATGAAAATAPVPATTTELAPPPPPPWTGGPTDAPPPLPGALMPAGAAHVPGPGETDQATAKITEDNRFQMLEARLAADEKAANENAEKMSWLKKLKFGGYIQPQLLWQGFNTAASPNATGGVLPAGIGVNSTIANSAGTTTNPDFFRLRRARLKAEFMPTEYARFVFEIDPTLQGGTAGGTGTIARNVEAQGIIRWTPDVVTEVGMGIFKIPLGREVLQSDADRIFIERSWGEQNLTPAEFDTGIKAYTTAKFPKAGIGGKDARLEVQVAVVNGVTEGEKNFVLVPDLNKGKDVVARINYDLGDFANFGVSGYYGQGANVDATALRFKQFPRTALNGEVELYHEWSKELGKTRVLGELTFARNLDRGVKYAFALPAVPSDVSIDAASLEERNFWVRIEQDVTEWVTLGARFDTYTPDDSIANNARDTYSFVAAVHFTKGLQWMLEFDHAIDNVHKANGVAPSKQIETLSNVLQVRF